MVRQIGLEMTFVRRLCTYAQTVCRSLDSDGVPTRRDTGRSTEWSLLSHARSQEPKIVEYGSNGSYTGRIYVNNTCMSSEGVNTESLEAVTQSR